MTMLSHAIAFSVAFCHAALGHDPLCRMGEPASATSSCKINGEGCAEIPVTFDPLNLTVWKWDSKAKNYSSKPVGQLEAHVAVGGADDWQMYLHGPLLRPKREQGEWSMPPFYVSATITNKVYRFEQLKKRGAPGQRGQKMDSVSKVVAHAVAPSTAFAIDDAHGDIEGMLVAEGQPFYINSPLDPDHEVNDFGGVDYIKDNCTRIFPNKLDNVSHVKGGDVTNTVSCHPHTGICFFSVWKFYDDQAPMWNNLTKKWWPDCLHYCVSDSLNEVGAGCKKSGVVRDEHGEAICSKPGVGAVHGMTVSTVKPKFWEDPNEFDIFLVFTGGATFVGGESSMKKVRCKKNANGDLSVLKSEVWGRDLFETSVNRTSGVGMAPVDVGGDHAWVDESGDHVWVSTFRTANAGVHMLDYKTGALIYSVHGTANYLKGNYAYSAGVHGMGSFGMKDGTLVLGTSACTHPEGACFPAPWNPVMKAAGMEARGLMYVIDMSELLPLAAEVHEKTATIVV